MSFVYHITKRYFHVSITTLQIETERKTLLYNIQEAPDSQCIVDSDSDPCEQDRLRANLFLFFLSLHIKKITK